MKRAACLWLHRPDGHVLAVTRRHGTDLCLPGGKCDPGESFEVAAAREAFEETGVRVPLEALIFLHQGPCESTPGGIPDYDVVAYLVDWQDTYGPVAQQEDGIRPQWVTPDELLARSAMPVYNQVLRAKVAQRAQS
jgi:8-oxo-dGTP pyrophosphatase MutT (NUDIX family)